MPAKRSTAIRERFRARAKATQAACYLCGEPIAYDIPYPNPRSFVADHIESLHRGGADALSNLAAAHRLPNVNATARRQPVLCPQ